MGFLDGEIISYGEPVRDFGDATWDEDGYIIWGGSIEIDNVKTDTGKTYEIVYGVYATVRDHPEYEGVTDLLVIDTKKQEKLDKVVDLIKDKYGYETITRAGDMKHTKNINRKD